MERCIDRIHRAIAKGGLDSFNATSLQMTHQQKGGQKVQRDAARRVVE